MTFIGKYQFPKGLGVGAAVSLAFFLIFQKWVLIQLPIGPLEIPAEGGRTDGADVLKSEAVRLFEDRAVSARSDFSVTNDNASVVAEICRRLDGMAAHSLRERRMKLIRRLIDLASDHGRAQRGC